MRIKVFSRPSVLLCWLCVTVAAGLALLYGCGGSGIGGIDPVSIIGGSVPVGTFRGIVVRADNPLQTVAGAAVSMTPQASGKSSFVSAQSAMSRQRATNDTQNGQGFLTGTQQTDINGMFNLGYTVAGNWVFSVVPSQADLTKNYAWPLALTDRQDVQVVAALWPSTFDPSTVQSVMMPIDQITMHPGDTLRFKPVATNKNGQPIPLTLSLLASGGVGVLAPDGTFTASTPGTGQVIGWIGGHSATTQISVLP